MRKEVVVPSGVSRRCGRQRRRREGKVGTWNIAGGASSRQEEVVNHETRCLLVVHIIVQTVSLVPRYSLVL